VQKTSSVSGADGGGPGAPAWATSKSGAGGGGLRVLDGSSDDDDDDERLRAEQRAAVQSAALSNDRGSAVSGLRPGGPGKRGALTNAEKKLSLLGLSTEVDSTRPRAARRAPQPAADDGSDGEAEGDDLPVSHARRHAPPAPSQPTASPPAASRPLPATCFLATAAGDGEHTERTRRVRLVRGEGRGVST